MGAEREIIMARPSKDGLSYFPMDIDFFQDIKIKTLKGKYGISGISVYLYLLCEIYKKGYYITLNDDLVLCMSDDLNINENCTRQIIKFLLSRSLLCEIKDSTLAKPDTVLTAKSIQQRYQEAKKGSKREIAVEAKYWLLNETETLSFIKVRPQNNLSGKNSNKSGKNSNKSGKNSTKESKVKESKVYSLSDGKAALKNLSQEQYSELCSMSSSSVVDKHINKLIKWQNQQGKCCHDPFETIKKWIIENGECKSAKLQSYDLDEWEQYAMTLDPNKQRASG